MHVYTPFHYFVFQTFSVSGPNPTVFTFWRPLTVNTTLRFNILGAVYGRLNPFGDKYFCFNVKLFGCLLTQGSSIHKKFAIDIRLHAV